MVVITFLGKAAGNLGRNSREFFLSSRHFRLSHRFEVSTSTFMLYKRNQVEDAVCRIFRADDERARELKLRLKRLLVTDRRLVRGKATEKRFAFFSQEAPGSGTEVMFSHYEAFALLAGLRLLEHGIPQTTVVSVLRQLRLDLERAYRETLEKDPVMLFDPKAVKAMARPGMIATDNTAPVFLVVAKLPDSTADRVHAAMTVCRGHDEVVAFLKNYAKPALASTMFEFTSLMHKLAANLAKTRPIKRGRSTV